MNPLIKIDLNSRLAGPDAILVELGCGNKAQPNRIGIDRLNLPGVDIVADLEQGLSFLPDNSVDRIYSKSVLEHIDNLEGLMREIWRVLKASGRNELFVPHFSNPYYYSDYTHRRFFGLYSFEYFSKEQKHFHRKVPSFYQDIDFETESMTLQFTSPWKWRKPVKVLAQKIFNLNAWWQEFYEENLCYLVPCHGIHATLRPIKK